MSTQTTNEETLINGVNIGDLGDNIQAISETPELANFKFRAKNNWVNGGHNQISLNSFYGTCQEFQRDEDIKLDADEPPVLLGTDKGANPAEYLLTALSSCMTTSLVYHAAAQGINIEKVESDYEGDINLKGFLNLDPQVRKG